MARHSALRLLGATLLAGACASVPPQLRGDAYAPIAPAEAARRGEVGSSVRWGGQILSVSHDEDQTCFDILSRPLDARARPERTDEALGRYRACAPGFYDPAVYETGREVTTIGRIDRLETQSFDSYELPIPVVSAEVVYLWPLRRYYVTAYPPYPYPPYYYGWRWGWPYPPWWGPYYGPWIGGTVVVPVPPHRHRPHAGRRPRG